MRLADKIATMARRGAPLPYDAEVEWIKCTGTQWLDTGIATNADSELVCDAKMEYSRIPYATLIGTGTGDGNILFSLTYSVGARAYIDEWKNMSDVDMNIRHLVKINSSGIEIDGVERFSYVSNFVSKDTIKLSCWKIDDPVRNGANSIYYSFCITSGSVKIIDLTPVRFTNENGVSEGAMYDRVSGQLFRNEGTGAFVIGPDKT